MKIQEVLKQFKQELEEKEKSDREQAIEWWKDQSDNIGEIADKYHKGCETITGIEIEQIWRKETQQIKMNNPYLDGEIITIDKGGKESSEFSLKPQVDFESVLGQLRWILNDSDYSLESRNNFGLFFELLSKSSTFAHKAHKELNKLMK